MQNPILNIYTHISALNVLLLNFILYQSTGPFIIDTSKPHFTGGKIDVKIEGRYLIANWSVDAFEDKDDPYPMNFQFAVGMNKCVNA